MQLQSKSAELAKLETRLKLNAESTESLRLKNEELLAELSEQQKLLQAQAQENESRAIVALQQSEETLGQVRNRTQYLVTTVARVHNGGRVPWSV